MKFIGDAATEARCRALADAVPLPHPFFLDALVDAVATQQGRPINLRPLPDTVGVGVSGMVVSTPTGYLIHQPVGADESWTLMCVSHELSHILCGHVTDQPRCHPPNVEVRTQKVHLQTWLPDMQEAITEWGPLYRCEMRSDQEQEAELTATLLVQRIMRSRTASQPVLPPATGETSEVLSRYVEVLNNRRRHGDTPK